LAKDGSLRSARCIKQNLNFYSTCLCDKEDKETVIDVLKMIKWIGTMRNRGFGKVSIEVEEINE
jgi:CRISPR-associated protein Csx10